MHAGRWLEPVGNGRPRGMIAIGVRMAAPVTESGLQAHFVFLFIVESRPVHEFANTIHTTLADPAW
jgi:hypothetical protein